MGSEALYLFIGFVVGMVVYYLADQHTKRLEKLEREQFAECVRLILLECVGRELEYTKLLQEYMDDLTKTLHDLPAELEVIVRRVTDVWE